MSMTKPPELAMLWESCDPHSALRERFGFSGVEPVTQWLATTLAKNWGLDVRSCERVLISAGNALAWVTADQGRLVAKWSIVSTLFPRLAEFARLTAWLGSRGLPVAAPLSALDGSHQAEVDGVSVCLLPQIEGELLDVTDLGHVREAGVVLARLHLALAAYPDTDRIRAVIDLPEATSLRERIARWLEAPGDDRPAAAIVALRDRLSALPAPDDLPVQLVHLDIRSANVLCAGSGVAAVLDFESVRLDHCVMDLAQAAVMLGTQFRSWGPVPPETHEALVAGYRSIRPLSPAEDDWLRLLILWHTVQAVPAGDDPAGWGRSLEQQLAVH